MKDLKPCKMCGEPKKLNNKDLCKDCENEFGVDYEKIDLLQDSWHTRHCACRLVWCDGECECNLKARAW